MLEFYVRVLQVATAIAEDVSLDAVISNIFADDSD